MRAVRNAGRRRVEGRSGSAANRAREPDTGDASSHQSGVNTLGIGQWHQDGLAGNQRRKPLLRIGNDGVTINKRSLFLEKSHEVE